MQNIDFIAKDEDFAVVINKGVTINAFNYITNNTSIDEGTFIEPFNIINNSQIGKNSSVTSSKIESSLIKDNVKIGPNANLRKDSIIEQNAKIGNFVEVKKEHGRRRQ